ncbi:MAG: phosphatidate cytidylyltransferase [Chitinophagales bacterium]|nr:phosphatidate cytidylyltransferase [Chitinophagales bacterium]
MSDLPRRALTAVIFGAVMLGGMLWSRYSFAALVFIINAGSLYEYLRLIKKHQQYTPLQAQTTSRVTLLLGCLFHASVWYALNDAFVGLMALLIIPFILLVIVTDMMMNTTRKWKNALLNAGGLVYVSLFLFCFYVLVAPPFYLGAANTEPWYPQFASIPLGIVLLVWANDTFAYFAGSLLGKHKIAPEISPKKSWEGFAGGLVFALVTAYVLSGFYFSLNPVQWMVVASLVVVFGTLGDFFESWLKRQAGVKDSGSLMPGHGGFLDRFDALIFCLPFVTIYLMFS